MPWRSFSFAPAPKVTEHFRTYKAPGLAPPALALAWDRLDGPAAASSS